MWDKKLVSSIYKKTTLTFWSDCCTVDLFRSRCVFEGFAPSIILYVAVWSRIFSFRPEMIMRKICLCTELHKWNILGFLATYWNRQAFLILLSLQNQSILMCNTTTNSFNCKVLSEHDLWLRSSSKHKVSVNGIIVFLLKFSGSLIHKFVLLLLAARDFKSFIIISLTWHVAC